MSPLVYIGPIVYALTLAAIVVLLIRAHRRPRTPTDEWCDTVDQDIDAGRPFYPARVVGPDELYEVDAVVFDWPIMAPSAHIIEFPRGGRTA